MTTTTKGPPPFCVRKGEGLVLNLHEGQTRTWDSTRRFVAMISGTQAGKTCFGPHWLKREIDRCGPGDYLAVTATFPLLDKKLLKEFLYVFRYLYRLGVYRDSDKVFEYFYDKEQADSSPTRVIFASAANPESIESATAKAAWLDEAGQQQFRRGSWEAILRRLSLAQGRVLITTTPYGPGWLKTELYDKWVADDEDIDVIQFDSLLNPEFKQEEFNRARRNMPAWKFNLFYRGQFSRPSGLIYDAFDEAACRIRRLWTKPPERYLCYVGHDFGPNNTAALWFAQDPDTGFLYFYREYHAGGLSSPEHAAKFIDLSQGENIIRRIGGAQNNEDGYRDAYTMAGWPIGKPTMKGVEAGIDRVYAWLKNNRIFIFDDLGETLDEITTYSRELDEDYRPIEGTIENKAHFHLMDCLRYAIGEFAPEAVEGGQVTQIYRLGPQSANWDFQRL